MKKSRGAERVNSALTESHGGSFAPVRGHAEGFGHLMSGILAPTVEQLFRLVN